MRTGDSASLTATSLADGKQIARCRAEIVVGRRRRAWAQLRQHGIHIVKIIGTACATGVEGVDFLVQGLKPLGGLADVGVIEINGGDMSVYGSVERVDGPLTLGVDTVALRID